MHRKKNGKPEYCCRKNSPENILEADKPKYQYPWLKKGGGKTDKTDKYILLPVRESPILTKKLFEYWSKNSVPIKEALELTKQDKKTNKLIKQKIDHYVKKTNVEIMDNIDIDILADYDEAFIFYSNIKERSNLGNLTYTACKPVKAILSKDEKTAIGIQLESGISVPIKPSSFDLSMYKLPISNQHYYPGFNELQKDEISDPRDSATFESIKFWKLYYDLCRKVADSKQRNPENRATAIMKLKVKELKKDDTTIDDEDLDRMQFLFENEYEHYDKKQVNYFKQQIDTNQFNEKLFYETRHKTFENKSQELKIQLDFDKRLEKYINRNVAFYLNNPEIDDYIPEEDDIEDEEKPKKKEKEAKLNVSVPPILQQILKGAYSIDIIRKNYISISNIPKIGITVSSYDKYIKSTNAIDIYNKLKSTLFADFMESKNPKFFGDPPFENNKKSLTLENGSLTNVENLIKNI